MNPRVPFVTATDDDSHRRKRISGNSFGEKISWQRVWKRPHRRSPGVEFSELYSIRMYDELQPDSVIHWAAKVEGVGYNQENPATLFYDNFMVRTQLLHEENMMFFLTQYSKMALHEDELAADWELISAGEPFFKIKPLDWGELWCIQDRRVFVQVMITQYWSHSRTGRKRYMIWSHCSTIRCSSPYATRCSSTQWKQMGCACSGMMTLMCAPIRFMRRAFPWGQNIFPWKKHTNKRPFLLLLKASSRSICSGFLLTMILLIPLLAVMTCSWSKMPPNLLEQNIRGKRHVPLQIR